MNKKAGAGEYNAETINAKDGNNMEKRDSIREVNCEVTSCRYHGIDCKCHADSITVESPSAMRKGETFCGTFAHKNGSNG